MNECSVARLSGYNIYDGAARLSGHYQRKYPAPLLDVHGEGYKKIFDRYKDQLGPESLQKLKDSKELAGELKATVNNQIQYLVSINFFISLISAKAQLDEPLSPDQYKKFVSLLKSPLKNKTVPFPKEYTPSFIESSLISDEFHCLHSDIGKEKFSSFAIAFDGALTALGTHLSELIAKGNNLIVNKYSLTQEEHAILHALIYMSNLNMSLFRYACKN